MSIYCQIGKTNTLSGHWWWKKWGKCGDVTQTTWAGSSQPSSLTDTVNWFAWTWTWFGCMCFKVHTYTNIIIAWYYDTCFTFWILQLGIWEILHQCGKYLYYRGGTGIVPGTESRVCYLWFDTRARSGLTCSKCQLLWRYLAIMYLLTTMFFYHMNSLYLHKEQYN